MFNVCILTTFSCPLLLYTCDRAIWVVPSNTKPYKRKTTPRYNDTYPPFWPYLKKEEIGNI